MNRISMLFCGFWFFPVEHNTECNIVVAASSSVSWDSFLVSSSVLRRTVNIARLSVALWMLTDGGCGLGCEVEAADVR